MSYKIYISTLSITNRPAGKERVRWQAGTYHLVVHFEGSMHRDIVTHCILDRKLLEADAIVRASQISAAFEDELSAHDPIKDRKDLNGRGNCNVNVCK